MKISVPVTRQPVNRDILNFGWLKDKRKAGGRDFCDAFLRHFEPAAVHHQRYHQPRFRLQENFIFPLDGFSEPDEGALAGMDVSVG